MVSHKTEPQFHNFLLDIVFFSPQNISGFSLESSSAIYEASLVKLSFLAS